MPKQLYRVKETRKGGKRGRFVGYSEGTRAEALIHAKVMRKKFGKEFNYRVVKA